MKLRRSVAVAAAVYLGMVSLSHAADPAPVDSSNEMAVSERIAKEKALTENTLYIVEDVTGHKARLHANRETKLDGAVEIHGVTTEIPFVSSGKIVEAPALPSTVRPHDAGQASETDTEHLRSLAHTLRDMADRRDLDIEILSRESAIVRDEKLIQRQWAFAQRLRALAEAAETRVMDIEKGKTDIVNALPPT